MRGPRGSLPIERFCAPLVASRLGIDREMADALLRAMCRRVGGSSFTVRAIGFAVATLVPILPAGLRTRALGAFLRPLLETPAALVTFAAGHGDPWASECAGLAKG